MTEWPQDRRERFWRGLGVRKANASYFWGDVCVADQEYDVIKCRWIKGKFKWLNPHDEDKVHLEVLLDGLERLCKENRVRFRITAGRLRVFDAPDKHSIDERDVVDEGYNSISELRTAIITAIELMEAK